MNPQGSSVEIVSPWGAPGLTTEEDLRSAQEYFFQTHATNSRMIAEGRTAQGFMKSYTRRKLEKEMGEDFKLYTGQELGESASEDSQGIRGEMNNLLRYVYERIAPDQPIISPVQEDVTILRHPHGALEVCFGMVFFYGSLLKKHVTLASNRRKVLKSILDEELFKWIWRLSVNYMLSDTPTRINFQDYHLSAGLPYIPLERQRATMPQKIFEIGQFMLGKTLEESHLRFPLAYYFLAYLRTMQSEVMAQPSLANPEQIYTDILKRKQMDPISHVLVAIDVLMNMKGNSSESFEDILKNEQADVERFIPPAEAQFIRHFDPYADFEAFGDAIRGALPAAAKAEIADQRATGSLALRLLLVLRAVTPSVRNGILDNVPAPVLVMLRNRVINGPQDDANKNLSFRIKAALDTRSARGEKFIVPPADRQGLAGVSTVKSDTVAARPEAPKPSHAAGSAGSPRKEPAAEAKPAAPRPGAAPPPQPPKPATPADAGPAEQAAPPSPAATQADPLLDQRLLVGWKQEGEQFTVIGITPRELFGLVGPEPRLVVHWVMLALQTGQILDVPPSAVNKALIERIVKTLLARSVGLPPARVGRPQAAQLANDLKDVPAYKALTALIIKGQLGDLTRTPGRSAGALESLLKKFGTKLGNFLRSPSQDEFREIRMGLTPEEKQVVQVLQKLARLGT